jgi:hypothetical protein
MKKDVLDTLPAALALTEMALKKADRVFDNSHRAMEQRYHLRHGIFARA